MPPQQTGELGRFLDFLLNGREEAGELVDQLEQLPGTEWDAWLDAHPESCSAHAFNFLLDDAMTKAVIERLGRGVKVEVLVPGTIDHAFVRQASRATWGPLLKAGVKIYEYQPALLHAKTMVIDGSWATVGSTNLDPRSFALSQELNVVIFDRAVARQMDEIFIADVAHAKAIDHASWEARGVRARLFELVVFPVRDML